MFQRACSIFRLYPVAMANSVAPFTVTAAQRSTESRRGRPLNLGGEWFNELGSKIELTVDDKGTITGDYYTAVEVEPGAEGEKPAHIIGHASPNGFHDTFGFNVLWKKGASTTSWAGEYKECNGEPMLFTTWLLVSETDSCAENWMSTRVGKDCFTRYKQQPPPDMCSSTSTQQSETKPWGGNWPGMNTKE